MERELGVTYKTAWRMLNLIRNQLMDEQDAEVNLLERLLHHARATAQFNVYFGRGRDRYDAGAQRRERPPFHGAPLARGTDAGSRRASTCSSVRSFSIY